MSKRNNRSVITTTSTTPASSSRTVSGESESLETLLRIPQVAHILGLGRKKIYQLMYFEGLPTLRFGRAVRVDPASLRQWIKQREEPSA